MNESLTDKLLQVFAEWLAVKLADTAALKSMFDAYADLRVQELTGHTAEEWRGCHVRAVEIE